ncbi:transposase [Longimonas sp.]|uniref:transposase n=1 Tax=Longimonas sp. TaxID=2039626 RepID=UPI0033656CD5
MALFKGTYRIESARHPTWDYRSPGWYFVTICTHQRAHFFGTIQNDIMGLSAAGCVAHQFWTTIPDHFDHVRLDAFVVMPNHVHGLLGIMSTPNDSVETLDSNVSTGGDNEPVDDSVSRHMSRISPDPGSVPTIIRSYKSACTKRIRRAGAPDFAWQSRYHDRIVRSEREFHAIRQYITNNPAQWTHDRLYSP